MSSIRTATEAQRSPITLVPQFSINLKKSLRNYPVIDLDRVEGVVGANGIVDPIGEGNEHYVMRYLSHPLGDARNNTGGHSVLKIPKIGERALKTWETPAELFRTYSQLRRYFGEAITETYFVSSVDNADPGYCMIQREIPVSQKESPDGNHLTVDLLLTNPGLLQQFHDIVENNARMYHETGEYLPLLGREGAYAALRGKGLLTNVVVEGEGENAQLRVIDFGLLAPNAQEHLKNHPTRRRKTLPELLDAFRAGKDVGTDLLNEAIGFGEWVEDVTEAHIEAVRDGACLVGNEIAIEYYFLHRLRMLMGQEASL